MDLLDKASAVDLSNSKGKITPSTSQQIVDWVLDDYNYLLVKEDMIKRGFGVCGATSTDPERVINDTFYWFIWAKVQEEIKDYDNKLLDDEANHFLNI